MRSWHERNRRIARRTGQARQGAAGGSSVDPNTTAPVDCGSFLATLTERLFRRPARSSSHQQAILFCLSRNATRLNQDDVAGLAAESAFDYDSLEKRMLLEAAAWECTLQMQYTCSSGRACHPEAFCACPSATPGYARKAAPRHAFRRTPGPLIRVPDKQCL